MAGLSAVLFELPDTIWAARKLYPDPTAWEGIETVAGSVLEPCIGGEGFDLILLSNIIHAYSPAEATGIVKNFAALLAPGGTVVVHDYLGDLHGADPVKGALYDLHMLINTYNGRVYKHEEMLELLNEAGLGNVRFFHLQSDTSLFLAKSGSSEVGRGIYLAAAAGLSGELGRAPTAFGRSPIPTCLLQTQNGWDLVLPAL